MPATPPKPEQPMPTPKANLTNQAHLPEAALRQLLSANAVSGVVARGSARGFSVEVELGDSQGVLVNAKGEPRSFATVDTVAAVLSRMGCHRFTVDATNYTPGRIRPAQPARSLAMKAGKLPKAQRPIIKR